MSSRLIKNRLFIDLIHGKKFNKGQREAIRKAIDSGLLNVELNRIAKEGYSKEHIEQFTTFLKNNNYSDNKILFQMFNDEKTDHKILDQVNKGLKDGLTEEEILLYAIPDKFTVEQMNELRLFIKQKEYSIEYFNFIFDSDLTAESMKMVREAESMEIPIEEINTFDKTSELYPTMVKAICDGILPNEVQMILDVSDKKDVFDSIVNGYSVGLSDDEISACLETDDYSHLQFHLDIMAECHDVAFVNKIMSISEMQRRNILDSFKSEKSYFGYLMHIHETNQMNREDQYEVFLSDCGKLDDQKVLTDHTYLNSFTDKVLSDSKKVEKLRVKGYLLEAISEDYKVSTLPDMQDITAMIKNKLQEKYKDLIIKNEDLQFFLSKMNQMDELLENHVGEIKNENGYLCFYMKENFEIQLKEYKNYYDLDKIRICYAENKYCEFPKSKIEELEKETRKLYMNDHAQLSSIRKKERMGIER